MLGPNRLLSSLEPEKNVVALKLPSMAALPFAMLPALITDCNVATVPPVNDTAMVDEVIVFLVL